MTAIEAMRRASQADLPTYQAVMLYAADLWGGPMDEFMEQVTAEEFHMGGLK
jgi:hypothetical protein